MRIIMKRTILFITSLLLVVGCSSMGKKGEITKKIKSSMNDPDSFKLRDFKKTYSTDCNETYVVKFSGKNVFGGMNKQTFYVIYKNGGFCTMGDLGEDIDERLVYSGGSMDDLIKELLPMWSVLGGCDC